MKTLIEQLRDGEIAVKNDGRRDELARVLKAAFPKDSGSSCSYSFYIKTSAIHFKGINGLPEE